MNSSNSHPRIVIAFIFSFHLFSISTSSILGQQQQEEQQPLNINPPTPRTPPQNAVVQNASDHALKPQMTPAAAEKQEFLAAHNKVRLHFGEPLFVWDANLARYARRYARRRAADCDLVHSHGPYGENIFWGSGNLWTPADAVRLWVREHRYYNRRANNCEPGNMCGHYTQVVWRESLRLGCARVQCDSGDIFAVCSYDPQGNYIGEHPFGQNIINGR